jgi:hypothetical protein
MSKHVRGETKHQYAMRLFAELEERLGRKSLSEERGQALADHPFPEDANENERRQEVGR